MLTTGANPEAAILKSELKNDPGGLLANAVIDVAPSFLTKGVVPLKMSNVRHWARAGQYQVTKGLLNAQNKAQQD